MHADEAQRSMHRRPEVGGIPAVRSHPIEDVDDDPDDPGDDDLDDGSEEDDFEDLDDDDDPEDAGFVEDAG